MKCELVRTYSWTGNEVWECKGHTLPPPSGRDICWPDWLAFNDWNSSTSGLTPARFLGSWWNHYPPYDPTKADA